MIPFLIVFSAIIALSGICALARDDRSEEEQRLDDEEQIKYLKEHSNNC